MRKLAFVAWLGLMAPLVLAEGPDKNRTPRPNLVLITIDTLRADRLSCYGYPRRTSPNIDQLAAQGVLFQNAYSPIPLTGPAHVSLMTSLYPQQHGAFINGVGMSARPRPLTLAQILRRLKYRTAAFVSAWVLKKKLTGLGRGFNVYNEEFDYRYRLMLTARTGQQVTAAALRWLRKRRGRPFFLWVHYFDPHGPYRLHPQFAHLPATTASSAGSVPARVTSASEMSERQLAYDSEIAYTDHYVGQILGQLTEMGVRDRTLIALTADHGESLGENEYWGHGDRLYQPIVRIPLVVSYPGVLPPGRTVTKDVGLLDVMPTILDYLGIAHRLPLEGRSLRSFVESSEPSSKQESVYFLTYAEPALMAPSWLSWMLRWGRSKMVPSLLGFAAGRRKVVLEGGKKQLQVYQLDETARVERLLKQVSASESKAYREQVSGWFQHTNRELKPEGRLSKEDEEALRSLGYADR